MKSVLITIAVHLVSTVTAVGQEVPLNPLPIQTTAVSGSSLAWGDVDGDGDLDLAVGGSARLSLFYNSDGILEEEWSRNSDSRTLLLSDIDTDGLVDLVFGDSVLLSSDGQFGFAQAIALPAEPTDLGDFDNDGDLDLLATSAVYLNRDGVFDDQPVWVPTYPADCFGGKWADMNNDGYLDIVCIARLIWWDDLLRLAIYHNDAGNLTDSTAWLTNGSIDLDSADVLHVGDLNNDGQFDVLCEYFTWDVYAIVSDHGVLQWSALTPWENFGRGIDLGDVDNDGDLDIVTRYSTSTNIYLNSDSGFSAVPDWETTGGGSAAWGDIDNDGKLELATIGYGSLRLYAGESDQAALFGGETQVIKVAPSSYVDRPLHWGDVNADGYPDLLADSALFMNDRGVIDSVALWYGNYWARSWGDVDGDGDSDLAIAKGYLHVSLLLSDGSSLGSEPVWTGALAHIGILPSARSMAWGDFTGNGLPDLACGNQPGFWVPGGENPAPAQVFVNSGGRLSDTATWIASDSSVSYQVEWSDVDRDGDLDLLCRGSGVKLFKNNGGMLQSEPKWVWDSQSGETMVLGDVDRDGYPDLGFGNAIYLNQGGQFSATPYWTPIAGDLDALIDVDGDGFRDACCYSPSDGGTYFIYMNRGGQFDDMPEIGLSAGPIASWADIDIDGDMDLAVTLGDSTIIYTNSLVDRCTSEKNLLNTPPCMTVRPGEFEEETGYLPLLLEITDVEYDPGQVWAEYLSPITGEWLSATLLGADSRLASSPVGESHIVYWSTETDDVSGKDLQLRLMLGATAAHAGRVQHGARTYPVWVEEVEGRPYIELAYPALGATIQDTLIVLSRMWDNVNYSHFSVQMSAFPDTAVWVEVHSSSTEIRHLDIAATIDVSGFEDGDYVCRVIAHDANGNQRVADRTVRRVTNDEGAPSVVHMYPAAGATHVPGNAPVVVQFDRPVNQSSLHGRSLRVFSESGMVLQDAIYDYNSASLSILPDMSYGSGDFHYAVVSDGVVGQDGIIAEAERALYFRTSDEPPTNDVNSLRPYRGQINVGTDTDSLKIYFNRYSAHRYATVFSLAGDTLVNDTVAADWSPGSVPISGLLPKTYYLVRISDSPAFDGESDYMSYFITEDTEMPMVVDYIPSNQAWLVGLKDEVTATFNKPLNIFSIDSSSFYVSGPHGRVPGFFDFGIGDVTEVSFSPDAPYSPATEYTVVLTSHVQDEVGNRIDGISWNFTTGVFDTVGYEGGVLGSGIVELRFPSGAIDTDTEVGFGLIPEQAIEAGYGTASVGLALDIIPRMSLNRDVLLTVRIPDSISEATGGHERIAFYKYDTLQTVWEFLGGTANGDRLSVAVGELGEYAVFRGDNAVTTESFVGEISLNSRVIHPRSGGVDQELIASFTISQPTHVEARIYSTSGRLVKALEAGRVADPGENLLRWDGHQDDGTFAPDGLYILFLKAQGLAAQKTFVILNK